MMPLFGLGADPFSLLTRKLQELKAGVVGPSPGEPAPKSTINWWCWDHPGFKDCHKLAFEAAQHQCESSGKKDDGTCLVTTADALVKQGCQCPAEPPQKGMSEGTKLVLVGLGLVAVVMFMGKKKEKG
jgi:hypothetical protein